MSASTPVQNNFTGGELSPQMLAVLDFDKTYNSCKTLQNMFVLPQGGVARRPGTRYVNSTKYSDRRSLLIPFIFSTVQAYVLEFGHQYIRVFKDRGQVAGNLNPELISNGSFDSGVSDWIDGGIDSVVSWDGTYKAMSISTTHEEKTYFSAEQVLSSSLTAGTYEFSIKLLSSNPESSGINARVISGSGGPGNTLMYLSMSAPGIYSTSFNVTTDSTYTRFTVIGFGDRSEKVIVDDVSLKLTSSSAIVEIATTYDESELRSLQFCQSADELYLVHPNHKPAKLTRTSHVNWTLSDITFTAQPADWATGNYPGSISFFDQRLCFGGVPSKPRTVYCTRAGDFFNFTVAATPVDTDAVIATFTDNEVNAIQWMYPYSFGNIGRLLLGTSSGTGSFGSNTLGDTLTPSNPKFNNNSGTRAGTLVPKRADGSILATDYYNRHVVAIAQDSNGNTISTSLMLLAEHLTSGGKSIIDYAYMSAPTQILWCVISDGSIIALTYLPSQQVYAWHRHSTQGQFESVCCIPSAIGSDDEVWCIARRTVNGADARFVEYLTPQFDLNNLYSIQDGVFVDCSLSASFATPAATINYDIMGNGVEVTGIADGQVFTKTVTAGAITLDTPASNVTVGLAYDSILTPVTKNTGSPLGTAEGKLKRISEVSIRLFNTAEFQFGRSDKLYTRYANNKNNTLATTIHRFSDFPGDWSMETDITAKQSKPLPMTILSIIPTMDTSERA